MPAENLRQALNILDPERALRTADEIDDYFVEREQSPLVELKILLTDIESPQKVLFSGHRGSGKSTELGKLSLDLADEFYIVHYSIKSILNLFDLTYVDVLLSLGLELFRRATADRLGIKESVFQNVLDFQKEITKEVEMGVSAQPGVQAELNLYVVKLSSKLGAEARTREIIREKVSPRLSDLLENIDFVAREVERVTRKRLLFIVEDLDKTDLAKSKSLFYDYASSLLAPAVSIIYTFPIALRHDNAFIQIENYFINSYVLPNIKTCHRNGIEDPQGRSCLQDILTLRVADSLFEAGVLSQLAQYSGGIPRELISLARLACLEALKTKASIIIPASVDRAILRKRMDYQVLLSQEQLQLLAKIYQTKKVDNDEPFRQLLHNLSALEYRNDIGVWYDVHPLVAALLPEAPL